jgi:hypothetical protein
MMGMGSLAALNPSTHSCPPAGLGFAGSELRFYKSVAWDSEVLGVSLVFTSFLEQQQQQELVQG